eukprot:tig00021537_g22276.t1
MAGAAASPGARRSREAAQQPEPRAAQRTLNPDGDPDTDDEVERYSKEVARPAERKKRRAESKEQPEGTQHKAGKRRAKSAEQPEGTRARKRATSVSAGSPSASGSAVQWQALQEEENEELVTGTSTVFDTLPLDLFVYIVRLLRVHERPAFAATCRSIRARINSEESWRELCAVELNVTEKASVARTKAGAEKRRTHRNWKQTYIEGVRDRCAACMKEKGGRAFRRHALYRLRLCRECERLPEYLLMSKGMAKKEYFLNDEDMGAIPHASAGSSCILFLCKDLQAEAEAKYGPELLGRLKEGAASAADRAEQRAVSKRRSAQLREAQAGRRGRAEEGWGRGGAGGAAAARDAGAPAPQRSLEEALRVARREAARAEREAARARALREENAERDGGRLAAAPPRVRRVLDALGARLAAPRSGPAPSRQPARRRRRGRGSCWGRSGSSCSSWRRRAPTHPPSARPRRSPSPAPRRRRPGKQLRRRGDGGGGARGGAAAGGRAGAVEYEALRVAYEKRYRTPFRRAAGVSCAAFILARRDVFYSPRHGSVAFGLRLADEAEAREEGGPGAGASSSSSPGGGGARAGPEAIVLSSSDDEEADAYGAEGEPEGEGELEEDPDACEDSYR